MSKRKSFKNPVEYFASSSQYGAPGTGYPALKRTGVITDKEESNVALLAKTFREREAVGNQLAGPAVSHEKRRPWTRKEKIAVAIASAATLATFVFGPKIVGDDDNQGSQPMVEVTVQADQTTAWDIVEDFGYPGDIRPAVDIIHEQAMEDGDGVQPGEVYLVPAEYLGE